MSIDPKSAAFAALGAVPDFSHLPRLSKLSPSRREKFLTWLDRGNLSLYLLDRLKSHGAQNRLPPAILDALSDRLQQNRARTDEWLGDFRSISSILRKRDIPHIALKGFTLVPEFCPRFELRHQGDIDLLIDPVQAPAAQTALAELGYQSRGAGPSAALNLSGPGDERVAMNESVYRAGRVRKIEFHSALPEGLGPIALNYPQGQWERSYVPRGTTYWTLSRPDRFIYQLFHAFKHVTHSWLRPGWLFEISHFLQLNQHDQSLWNDVVRLSGDDALFHNALGLILDLARKILHTPVPRTLQASFVDPLPRRLLLWNEHFGRQFVFADFPGNKLYLFAQQVFVNDPAAWRAHFYDRLFPIRTNPALSEIRGRSGVHTLADRWNRLLFVRSKVSYHAKGLTAFPYHWLRWRLLQRFSQRA